MLGGEAQILPGCGARSVCLFVCVYVGVCGRGWGVGRGSEVVVVYVVMSVFSE
jgi:hypothetical protein